MSNLHSFIVITLALAAIFVPQLLAVYLDARRNSESAPETFPESA